jgi:hypothetical protein
LEWRGLQAAKVFCELFNLQGVGRGEVLKLGDILGKVLILSRVRMKYKAVSRRGLWVVGGKVRKVLIVFAGVERAERVRRCEEEGWVLGGREGMCALRAAVVEGGKREGSWDNGGEAGKVPGKVGFCLG